MNLLDSSTWTLLLSRTSFLSDLPSYFIEGHLYESFVAKFARLRHGARAVLLGRITSMAEAERALASGVCDLVGAARGLDDRGRTSSRNALEDREERQPNLPRLQPSALLITTVSSAVRSIPPRPGSASGVQTVQPGGEEGQGRGCWWRTGRDGGRRRVARNQGP